MRAVCGVFSFAFWAFQKFGDYEGRTALLADIVNGENVGVVERGYGPASCSKRRSPSASRENDSI
jgi:hypothetical protein